MDTAPSRSRGPVVDLTANEESTTADDFSPSPVSPLSDDVPAANATHSSSRPRGDNSERGTTRVVSDAPTATAAGDGVAADVTVSEEKQEAAVDVEDVGRVVAATAAAATGRVILQEEVVMTLHNAATPQQAQPRVVRRREQPEARLDPGVACGVITQEGGRVGPSVADGSTPRKCTF